MFDHPRRFAALAACLFALFAVLPWGLDWIGERFFIQLASLILIYALAAASLDLILGFGGMVSFGHAAFVGIGAYAVGILLFHEQEASTLFGLSGTASGWISWPIAVASAALAALAIGLASLRTRGVPFIMITLAFGQMVFFLTLSLRRYGGQDGIPLWYRSDLLPLSDLTDPFAFYYVCLACLVLFLFGAYRLLNARFGRVLRAAKDNEQRMRALGFPVTRYRLTAFVIAGAAAGLAGALLVNATYFVGPAYLAWHRSGDLIVMVVLGGMGSLLGPVLGASALLTMEEFLPALIDAVSPGNGEHWRIVLGPVLLLVVLVARGGLFGLLIRGPR